MEVDRTGLDDDEDGSVDEDDEHDHSDDEDTDEHDEEEHPETTRGAKSDAGKKNDGGTRTNKADASVRGHNDGGPHAPSDGDATRGGAPDLDAGVGSRGQGADAHVDHPPATGSGVRSTPPAGGTTPRPPTTSTPSAGSGTRPPTSTPSAGDPRPPVGPSATPVLDAGAAPSTRAPVEGPTKGNNPPAPPPSDASSTPDQGTPDPTDHTGHDAPDASASSPTPATETPSTPSTPAAPPAADPCEGLKGPDYGLEFAELHCNRCHSSEAAMVGIVLDTPDILGLTDLIQARVIDKNPRPMPPGAGLGADQTVRLAQWLQCNK